MLEQEQAGCTIVGNVSCDLLDIFWCEQAHQIVLSDCVLAVACTQGAGSPSLFDGER